MLYIHIPMFLKCELEATHQTCNVVLLEPLEVEGREQKEADQPDAATNEEPTGLIYQLSSSHIHKQIHGLMVFVLGPPPHTNSKTKLSTFSTWIQSVYYRCKSLCLFLSLGQDLDTVVDPELDLAWQMAHDAVSRLFDICSNATVET